MLLLKIIVVMKRGYRSIYVYCYFWKLFLEWKGLWGILNEWGMIYVHWYFEKLFLVWKGVMGDFWVTEKGINFTSMLFKIIYYLKSMYTKICMYLKKVCWIALIHTTLRLTQHCCAITRRTEVYRVWISDTGS